MQREKQFLSTLAFVAIAITNISIFVAACDDGEKEDNEGTCPEEDSGVEPDREICTPGYTATCVCPDFRSGSYACNTEGTGWGECHCPNPCVPGNLQVCWYVNGPGGHIQGTQVCKDDGSGWGTCELFCTPNTTKTCVCSGDTGSFPSGIQTCSEDGGAWGDCKCPTETMCEAGATQHCACPGSDFLNQGTQICATDGASWGECTGCPTPSEGEGEGSAEGEGEGAVREICNGVDDNGDGRVDEGYGVGVACPGSFGVCAAATGVMECRAGGFSACSVDPGGSNNQAVPEICDGLDNDCDGLTDEENVCPPQPQAPRLVIRRYAMSPWQTPMGMDRNVAIFDLTAVGADVEVRRFVDSFTSSDIGLVDDIDNLRLTDEGGNVVFPGGLIFYVPRGATVRLYAQMNLTFQWPDNGTTEVSFTYCLMNSTEAYVEGTDTAVQIDMGSGANQVCGNTLTLSLGNG